MNKSSEEEILLAQIEVLLALPHSSVWVGTLDAPRQKSVIYMEDLIKLLSEKRNLLRELQLS